MIKRLIVTGTLWLNIKKLKFNEMHIFLSCTCKQFNNNTFNMIRTAIPSFHSLEDTSTGFVSSYPMHYSYQNWYICLFIVYIHTIVSETTYTTDDIQQKKIYSMQFTNGSLQSNKSSQMSGLSSDTAFQCINEISHHSWSCKGVIEMVIQH